MNPSIKRLLGALLLIGTLGVTSVLAIRAGASTDTPSHDRSSVQVLEGPVGSKLINKNLAQGDLLNG